MSTKTRSMAALAAALSLPISLLPPLRAIWYGVPMTRQLELPKRDLSQHNTLRHDQVERRRKMQRKANHITHKRYRRARTEDNG